jgi:hypothetical protein
MILELPAPKEVSILWNQNLSASSISQDFSLFTRSRDRQSATNTLSYRCCSVLFSLHLLSASCALPLHLGGGRHWFRQNLPLGLKKRLPPLKEEMDRETERQLKF